MKVLVTGGAGYVGSPVVDELCAQGHDVRIFERLPRAESPQRDLSDVEYFTGDLRRDQDIRPALVGIDAVVHLAAVVIVRKLKDDAERTLLKTVNEEGAIALARAARQAGASRFVFASTCSVYEPTNPSAPASEASPVKATNEYTEGKITAEREILALRTPRFAPVVLRLATVYGASSRLNFEPLPNAWIREALAKGRLEVYGADSWRPYVHTRDTARAIATVLHAEAEKVSGQVFNIGSDDQNVQKRQVAEEVRRLIPSVQIHFNEAHVDPRNYYVSFAKAREVLGFRPREDLAQGLGELATIIREKHLVPL